MRTGDTSIFRDYQSSHPWITFQIDLNQCTHDVWMLLGQVQSKCEHIAGVPLLPETAKQLYKVYLSKGAHATTAIEGNTLSEEEVLQRVDGTLELSKSREYLGIAIDNIIKACNEIAGAVTQGLPLELTPQRIRRFNELVLSGLELEDGVVPGECRQHGVTVARYRGAPPRRLRIPARTPVRLAERVDSRTRERRHAVRPRGAQGFGRSRLHRVDPPVRRRQRSHGSTD